jgi:hypothetical protein
MKLPIIETNNVKVQRIENMLTRTHNKLSELESVQILIETKKVDEAKYLKEFTELNDRTMDISTSSANYKQ